MQQIRSKTKVRLQALKYWEVWKRLGCEEAGVKVEKKTLKTFHQYLRIMFSVKTPVFSLECYLSSHWVLCYFVCIRLSSIQSYSILHVLHMFLQFSLSLPRSSFFFLILLFISLSRPELNSNNTIKLSPCREKVL